MVEGRREHNPLCSDFVERSNIWVLKDHPTLKWRIDLNFAKGSDNKFNNNDITKSGDLEFEDR